MAQLSKNNFKILVDNLSSVRQNEEIAFLFAVKFAYVK